ncbi:MAG: GNAT family N-acetyltransferase, partial [Phreatobacter sp.]|nr:GNAT family N-acetyltransferase [Phreatobacter sp.]
MNPADIAIAAESPLQPEVERLIAASDAFSATLYPAEGRHGSPLDRLASPDMRFLVARRGGSVVGCAGLLIAGEWGELKRMFVAPEARGVR